MHDYAVFGHDRASIGRWLGFAAIAVAGGVAQILAIASNLTGLDAFTKATITTGLVYLALHWLFNKWIWKVPFFEIPNISGEWKITGQTLNDDGSTKYDWNGVIGIEQTWKCILIHLRTPKSQSMSYTATLSRRYGPTGGWLLSYSYKNEPELEKAHELNSHKGYSEIEFDKELKYGKASYFNSSGRRTFGIISLEKISE